MKNLIKTSILGVSLIMASAAFATNTFLPIDTSSPSLQGQHWRKYTLVNKTGQTIYVQYASQNNLNEGKNHKVIGINGSNYVPLHRLLFAIPNSQSFTIAYKRGLGNWNYALNHGTNYDSSLQVKIMNSSKQKVMKISLHSSHSHTGIRHKKRGNYEIVGYGSDTAYSGAIVKNS